MIAMSIRKAILETSDCITNNAGGFSSFPCDLMMTATIPERNMFPMAAKTPNVSKDNSQAEVKDNLFESFRFSLNSGKKKKDLASFSSCYVRGCSTLLCFHPGLNNHDNEGFSTHL